MPMMQEPESPEERSTRLHLLKRARQKAMKDVEGQHWTKDELDHRVKVWYRRLQEREQQERRWR
jgi:hypothetical protein